MGISIHTTWKTGWENINDVYRMIKEAGFDGVDWDLSDAWSRATILTKVESPCVFTGTMEEIHAHYKEELDAIHRHGLEIYQAHSPFPPYVPGFPSHTEYAKGIYQKCLEFCGEVGVKKLVIHGASQELKDKSQDEEANYNYNIEFFSSLIPAAKKSGVKILLENLFTRMGKRHVIDGTCADYHEAVSMVDELNALAGEECFAFCLDTGHLNITGKNQATFIRHMGRRIQGLHLHDNWGEDDVHMMPYTGNIIWEDVLTSLREVGYKENINFETYRQTMLDTVPRELVPVFLKAQAEVARYFEKRILG